MLPHLSFVFESHGICFWLSIEKINVYAINTWQIQYFKLCRVSNQCSIFFLCQEWFFTFSIIISLGISDTNNEKVILSVAFCLVPLVAIHGAWYNAVFKGMRLDLLEHMENFVLRSVM